MKSSEILRRHISIVDESQQMPISEVAPIGWDGIVKAMKKHPEIGAEIICKLPGLERVSEIIRCHHERYDGNGYPRGLKGAQIPIEARIITVVDSFYAMIDHRVYNTPKTRPEALEELEINSGLQFDPEVVAIIKVILTRQERPDLVPVGTANEVSTPL